MNFLETTTNTPTLMHDVRICSVSEHTSALKQDDVIFLDLSKAFNTVSQNIILDIMYYYVMYYASSKKKMHDRHF